MELGFPSLVVVPELEPVVAVMNAAAQLAVGVVGGTFPDVSGDTSGMGLARAVAPHPVGVVLSILGELVYITHVPVHPRSGAPREVGGQTSFS